MNQLTAPPQIAERLAKPLLLVARKKRRSSPLLGEILLEQGALSPGDLIKAMALQAREDALFGEILLSNNMVSEAELARGLASQFGCDVATADMLCPDIRLVKELGAENCLCNGVLPLKRIGAATLVATDRPQVLSGEAGIFPASFGRILMVIATQSDLQASLLELSEEALVKRAETRVTSHESCRNWNSSAMARVFSALLLFLISGLVANARLTLLLLTGWAILFLVLNTSLKAAAVIANLRAARGKSLAFSSRRARTPGVTRLPKISVLVPLFREPEIASRLIRRLKRLSYPRELLDICLVVEADDKVTQQALAAVDLPPWIRQIRVPDAELKTKPRALNYALDFCKGSIIGVYDAEDAPENDQLHKVARRFQTCAPEVACLQGVLDFYNSRSNWLSRCFTIEYATWFRVMLPGLERLGLVIPLGGTTIFFRRTALEEIGGWDAHNVTEDADLGIRLARHGYRTELLPTLTEEEANCRLWPWVRQRSRWLKGYAITWAVHMQNPLRLMRDLGPWRFFGVQLLFLGALSQFLLAPLLWSFWLLPLGLPHPLQGVVSPTALFLLTSLFFLCELTALVVGMVALAPNRHRGLWVWIPTLHFYFPLATIAAYKGIWELITRPFYWDKTEHGHNPDIDTRAHNIRPANARLPNSQPLPTLKCLHQP